MTTFMNSFSKFLESEAGKKACDLELFDRLVRFGVKIDTVDALLKFARQRWPQHYPADFRKDPGTPFGREAMRRIWQQYLDWKENGALDRKAAPGPKAVAS